ncbi:E3 ubiquitin-protein ligase XIAP-like isoform X2 [Dreissena polymorpha]|uniref:E3 ubiquitin-protein ligase XIAP-like isoform X2 n=1 Tax=Dreissena polymorpha TaxID=45954 RepID=UPI0022643DE7|nr:E3 ubiquitin-protein ligase XIAP-like isoform X2 [Dreissena polymorpha]
MMGDDSSEDEEPKYRDWADEHTRLRSYRGWPAQMRQTPRDLAAAGLLYMGQGDRCKCYWCGGELHGWEPDDDPWVEHAKWFPQCGFVRQQKGVEYVNHIKYGERTNIESTSNQEFLRRPYVLAAMNDYGYTQEQVLEALHTYGVLILVTVQDIRKYVEELNSERQAAQTLARISERFVSSNRSDSSVAMTDRGQQVAQPSDDMEVSSGQLCSEDVRIEGMEESQYPDSLTQQQMQNLSLNSHSSSSISL